MNSFENCKEQISPIIIKIDFEIFLKVYQKTEDLPEINMPDIAIRSQ